MIKKKVFTALIASIACVAAFYACKKEQDHIASSAQMNFKSIVQSWQQKFDSSATEKDKNAAKAIVDRLDFSKVTKIEMSDNSVRYIIRIAKNYITPFNRFLCITSRGSELSLEGVFLSYNLSDIETVSTNRKLGNGSKVLLLGLDGYTMRGWATSAKGIATYAQGLSKNSYVEPSVGKFKQLPTGNNAYKINYMAEGGNEEFCIYHYEVWYVEETGEILAIEYLGKDCYNPQGGGDPAPPAPEGETGVCSFTEEEIEELSAGMGAGSNDIEVTGNITSIGHWPETGRYERSATKDIKFYTGSALIEHNKHPTFHTTYAGTEYKIGDYDLFWKWVPGSLKYNGVVEKGSPIACNSFEFSINHAPIILSDDGTKANAVFTYTGKQKFTCLLKVTTQTIDGRVDVWLDAQTVN